MPDLREQLPQSLRGRVCLLGLGNVDRGDDGLGVRLAEAVAANQYSPSAGMAQQPSTTGANSDVGFPLTPPLSLGERESHSAHGDESEAPWIIAVRPMLFSRHEPLPLTPSLSPSGGEGARRAGEGGEVLNQQKGGDISVIIAGTSPERFVGRVAERGFDHVVFLDAVEFGGAPGSVILLSSEEMAARFPQVSTHKISLSVLAKWIEASGTTRAWLLGVQPATLKQGAGLSPAVRGTLEILKELLGEVLEPERPGAPLTCEAAC